MTILAKKTSKTNLPVVRKHRGTPILTSIRQVGADEVQWAAFLDEDALPEWVEYMNMGPEMDGSCETMAHAKELAFAAAQKLLVRLQRKLRIQARKETARLKSEYERESNKIEKYTDSILAK
jgi:hypothetical protein